MWSEQRESLATHIVKTEVALGLGALITIITRPSGLLGRPSGGESPVLLGRCCSAAGLLRSPPWCSAARLAQNPPAARPLVCCRVPWCSAARLVQNPPAARPPVCCRVPRLLGRGSGPESPAARSLVWSGVLLLDHWSGPDCPSLSPCPLVLFSLNWVGDPSATPVRCPPSVLPAGRRPPAPVLAVPASRAVMTSPSRRAAASRLRRH